MEGKSIRKILFFLSNNARRSTKEIGKLLHISQQTASYTIKKLEEKKIIQRYQLIADPAKFGLINIIILLEYNRFDQKSTSQIKRRLKEDPNVVRIEEISQGADLLVEYSTPNLSYFNKQYRQFLYDLQESIRIKERFVIIVKHLFEKTYLLKRNTEQKRIIISGDRDPITLNKRQEIILQQLLQDPKSTMISIAQKHHFDLKTTIQTKRLLEKQKIIRRYSITLNYDALDIQREHYLINTTFNNLEEEKMFLEYCKQHKNIIEVTKTIGPYEIILTVERMKEERSPISDLRKNFPIRAYQIITSDNIIEHTTIPQECFNEKNI